MNLSRLPTISHRPAKRVGRGRGSGKGGHTTGRGTKGQKSRETIPVTFEGAKFKKSLVKRLPFLRGKGKLKPARRAPQLLSIGDLAKLDRKSVV